jgi:hypothetical protein
MPFLFNPTPSPPPLNELEGALREKGSWRKLSDIMGENERERQIKKEKETGTKREKETEAVKEIEEWRRIERKAETGERERKKKTFKKKKR